MNRKQSRVRYRDGTLLPRKHKAVYLGILLNDRNTNRPEIPNKIAEAAATMNRLKIFRNKADTTIEWKLKVLEAVIRSKLVYSLECLQLTQAEKDRINAFHIKCIRRVLHIPPTFIDKEFANSKVIQKASDEMQKEIALFSEMVQKQKQKLLGRTKPEDPMQQITFENQDAYKK